MVDKKLTMNQHCALCLKRPAVSWGKALTEDRGRWSCPSALVRQHLEYLSTFGLLSSRQTRNYSRGPSGELWRWWWDRSISLMRRVWGSWASGNQWQEKGQREQTGTLEYPSDHDKNFFTVRTKHWNRLPREVAESLLWSY